MIPRLPPDVEEKIIYNIPTTDTETLKACSYVSHWWRNRSQRRLFLNTVISFVPPDLSLASRAFAKFRDFVETVGSTKAILEAITSLRIPHTFLSTPLNHYINAFVNLRFLWIVGIRFDERDGPFTFTPSLVFPGSPQFPNWFLQKCPNLGQIRLENLILTEDSLPCLFRALGALPSSSPPSANSSSTSSSSLQTLTFRSCWFKWTRDTPLHVLRFQKLVISLDYVMGFKHFIRTFQIQGLVGVVLSARSTLAAYKLMDQQREHLRFLQFHGFRRDVNFDVSYLPIVIDTVRFAEMRNLAELDLHESITSSGLVRYIIEITKVDAVRLERFSVRMDFVRTRTTSLDSLLSNLAIAKVDSLQDMVLYSDTEEAVMRMVLPKTFQSPAVRSIRQEWVPTWP